MTAAALTHAILADRERRKAQTKPAKSDRPAPDGFDPFEITRWRVVAGGDPGYLVATPMRRGSVGFHVACRACGGEFESGGLAYCAECLALPADERRAIAPTAQGRVCRAPGCEQFIPRRARADTAYCSDACRQRARRERTNVTDNRRGLSDSPQSVLSRLEAKSANEINGQNPTFEDGGFPH